MATLTMDLTEIDFFFYCTGYYSLYVRITVDDVYLCVFWMYVLKL